MSCNCCCNNVLKVTSIQTNENGLYLIVSNNTTLNNGCKYTVVLPNNLIAPLDDLYPVYINVNSINYQLYDRTLGNYVYSDQLRFICMNQCENRVFRVVYGASPTHFKVISQELPQSSAS